MVFPGYARQSGTDPVNPQDLATKNYVDGRSHTLSCQLSGAPPGGSVATATWVPLGSLALGYNVGSDALMTVGASAVTVPYAGIYLVIVQGVLSLPNVATGYRYGICAYRNGAVIGNGNLYGMPSGVTMILYPSFASTVQCAANDTLGGGVYQASGSTVAAASGILTIAKVA
jgi:hypothetical protein